MRSPSIVPEPTTRPAEQGHPGVGLNTPEIDYFAMLSRAVARLDRDSYEARGAIYDRAQEVLAKRLASATPPFSEAEAAKQQLALREAIRRIEFADREDPELASVEEMPEQKAAAGTENTAPAALDDSSIDRKRKSLFGRVAARLLFAALVLGIGIAAYAYATGNIQLAFLPRFLGRVLGSAPVQHALLYERSATDPNAPAFNGTANWQLFSEGTGRSPEPVLQVDVQIPERGLSLVMSMRRETSEAAAMSHVVEFRFLRPDQSPFVEVSRIGSIGMTTSEHSRRAVVMGLSTKVAAGVFLFGLVADESEREANLRFLRELPWMDIPIVYEDGSQAVLSIEKGAAGERAINQFFSKPGQS